MRALISCGVYFLPSISTDQSVPMWRLTERMVRSTLVTAWFLAGWPTSTSPFLANATTDGVIREPSEVATTVGSPPSRTATMELVVPRSIPTARAIRRQPSWSGGAPDRLTPSVDLLRAFRRSSTGFLDQKAYKDFRGVPLDQMARVGSDIGWR